MNGKEFTNMKILNRKPKPEKIKKKEIKLAKRLKKKVASTLDWMDLWDVSNNMMILKDNKKYEYIKGVKLTPHQIYLDEEPEQVRIVESLRITHNKILCPLYFAFVFTPVNLDQYEAELLKLMELETDPVLMNLLEDDWSKAAGFKDEYRELEFFIMVKGKSLDEVNKNFLQTASEFKRAGMGPKELNDNDFKNYLAYVFESSMINDFYFSEGIFSSLKPTMIDNGNEEN